MTDEKQQPGNWYPFDNKPMLHKTGSASGRVIRDIEYSLGARITIEEGIAPIPYTVTLGVYGVLFHTYYTGTETDARKYAKETEKRIELFIEHLHTPEAERDNVWDTEYDRLIDSICE